MLLYPWPERFFPAAGEARVTCALIVANVLLSVLSNVCIRFGMMSWRADLRGVLRHMMRTPLIYAALACYGGAFVTYSLLMTRMRLGVVYPFMMGLNAVSLAAFAACFLGERPTARRMAGIALVIAGVWCLGS